PTRTRPDPARAWASRRGREGLSRGAHHMAGRAVGTRRADDARVEPWRPSAGRAACRSRGNGNGRRRPGRSMVDLLAGRLPDVSGDPGEPAGDRPMRSRRLVAGGVAALMSVALPAGAVAQQQPTPTFRAGADVVTVEASVWHDKRPLTGLKPADFELLDNGVP